MLLQSQVTEGEQSMAVRLYHKIEHLALLRSAAIEGVANSNNLAITFSFSHLAWNCIVADT